MHIPRLCNPRRHSWTDLDKHATINEMPREKPLGFYSTVLQRYLTRQPASNSAQFHVSASYQRTIQAAAPALRWNQLLRQSPKCLLWWASARALNAADLRRSVSAAEAAVRLTLEGNPLLPVTSHRSLQLRTWEPWPVSLSAGWFATLNSHTQTFKSHVLCRSNVDVGTFLSLSSSVLQLKQI